NNNAVPAEIHQEMLEALKTLEERMGQKLGDVANPLLVSVRSGAKFSMPGMMDTILNLGLNDETVKALVAKSNNPRFAYDCYRRFIQMYGNVVLEIPKHDFDEIFDGQKKKVKAKLDTELTAEDLQQVIAGYQKLVQKKTGKAFPQDALEQLQGARDAVFGSWFNPRAQHYRKMNQIPDDLGTAVNVQAMVFGNLGETSATGVGFTRNPATGEKVFYGEFLENAQGEDVVSGVRTPHTFAELETWNPAVYNQLREITTMLENHYRDIQDFEFTVQDGRLFLLQTRVGKRTPYAAARIALDMFNEGLIGADLARERTAGLDREALALPRIVAPSGAPLEPLARAASASNGVAVGEIALDEARAVARRAAGVPFVLVRGDAETSDIAALESAAGLLTQRGARTSHAAVVARQLGKVCLVGCAELQIDDAARTIKLGETTLREGELLTLDGNEGVVYAGAIQTKVEYPRELLARLESLRQRD
ncbi:MAG TPA: PEP/pyruvate-binding domain-containing protein, partial [Isosphaeraceae bacterium]|nr:PEP/pyruvate-binding domain-containing protein [Isosphaeraceae bacterium]